MADLPLGADGDAVGRHSGDTLTLEEHVGKWVARRMVAGVPARRCVLPFLTGAPKAVECLLCSKIIYPGEQIKCSVRRCGQMFHLNCAVKDTTNFIAESFRCPQHGCRICKQKLFFWRCGRCTVSAHTKCAPWPVIHVKDDQGTAICWRHPSDWLLQNENAKLTSSLEEVFNRLPLPYINEDFKIDSTIRDFTETGYKPPSYAPVRHNVSVTMKKHAGVHAEAVYTNLSVDSTCKDDSEFRPLKRYGKKSFIVRRRPHNSSTGAGAQHAASIGEEQNNMNSPPRMVVLGRLGLDHELPQDSHDESLGVAGHDADQQAKEATSISVKPWTRSQSGISKKRKAHPDSRSTQAGSKEQ